MAQPPSKPPTLLPGHTYLHITSPLPPDSLTSSLAAHPPLQGRQLTYVGKVGELKGEHIFEVVQGGGPAVGQVVRDVQGVEGVKGVKEMAFRQRSKREEL